MPYATDTFLTQRVPETKCLGSADRKFALLDAEAFVDLETYGDKAEQAHAYYAAHLLACRFPEQLGGEQGQPTSMKAGEIAASFAAPAAVDADSVGTTKWGRLFAQVCKQTLPLYQVG